jgi:hypothetical protein
LYGVGQAADIPATDRQAGFAAIGKMSGGGIMRENGAEDIAYGPRPNWRNAADYKVLLKLDRAGWAWKWLRRNPDYVVRMAERSPERPLLLPGTGVPIIPASAHDEAFDWGLRFRRGTKLLLHRGQAFLAGRLGCVGGVGRSAASAAARSRCLRHSKV